MRPHVRFSCGSGGTYMTARGPAISWLRYRGRPHFGQYRASPRSTVQPNPSRGSGEQAHLFRRHWLDHRERSCARLHRTTSPLSCGRSVPPPSALDPFITTRELSRPTTMGAGRRHTRDQTHPAPIPRAFPIRRCSGTYVACESPGQRTTANLGEHRFSLHTAEVGGSSPSSPTNPRSERRGSLVRDSRARGPGEGHDLDVPEADGATPAGEVCARLKSSAPSDAGSGRSR